MIRLQSRPIGPIIMRFQNMRAASVSTGPKGSTTCTDTTKANTWKNSRRKLVIEAKLGNFSLLHKCYVLNVLEYI